MCPSIYYFSQIKFLKSPEQGSFGLIIETDSKDDENNKLISLQP
jgi:hypothetical protein